MRAELATAALVDADEFVAAAVLGPNGSERDDKPCAWLFDRHGGLVTRFVFGSMRWIVPLSEFATQTASVACACQSGAFGAPPTSITAETRSLRSCDIVPKWVRPDPPQLADAKMAISPNHASRLSTQRVSQMTRQKHASISARFTPAQRPECDRVAQALRRREMVLPRASRFAWRGRSRNMARAARSCDSTRQRVPSRAPARCPNMSQTAPSRPSVTPRT